MPMQDHRRQPPPSTLQGYLQLPAPIVLDRLPVPIFAVHGDTLLYANCAFEQLVGRPAGSLHGCRGTELVDDHLSMEPAGLASVVRLVGGGLLRLRHADGWYLKVILSSLMEWAQGDDLITLVSVQDMSEHFWERGSRLRATS
jgi:hypothetical protein